MTDVILLTDRRLHPLINATHYDIWRGWTLRKVMGYRWTAWHAIHDNVPSTDYEQAIFDHIQDLRYVMRRRLGPATWLKDVTRRDIQWPPTPSHPLCEPPTTC